MIVSVASGKGYRENNGGVDAGAWCRDSSTGRLRCGRTQLSLVSEATDRKGENRESFHAGH